MFFKRFIKPNWGKSNINISATLAEFLGVPSEIPTLKILKNELEKGYKNVVFICIDGFGINPIKINLSKSQFLRKNIKKVLTSTFPSTTTNATTSLVSNKLPLQHGWFGWTLHFDEIDKNIDIYLHEDTVTGEKVSFDYPLFDHTDAYFDHAKTDYSINTVFPSYVHTKNEENRVVITNEFELSETIQNICKKDGKQFVYAYLSEPDTTMHDFGVSSIEAKKKIESINCEIEKLYEKVDDTLIVITADHGQIDVDGYVEFYKDKELNDMLVCLPYLDARTPAFKVKKGMEKEFEKLFKSKYQKDFKLYKTEYLLKKGYFGKTGEFKYLLGDYIAIGTFTHKTFLAHENMNRFKGHHTSLTEEMEVPLIILSRKN